MRFGYWLPVFGGWLRNVDDERMAATWEYVRTLAQQSEKWGYDLTLIAELNLNDIKGTQAPSLDAWSTAASLAAVTSTLELMVAVRPTFHEPALLAKQAANIDHISGGRLSLNVVSSWWADEAKQYGVRFDQHDDRYARTREWLDVVDGLWREPKFSYSGRYYQIEHAILEPKPISRPRPTIYAGGESEAAKNLIAQQADAYVMHGDDPERIGRKIEDLSARRERTGQPPLSFGVAGYTIVRDSAADARAELARITDVKQSAAGYEQLPAMDREHAARAAGVARRLFGLESRPAVGLDRHAGTGARSRARIRSRRREPAAAAVQSAARRNGALRARSDRAVSPGAVRVCRDDLTGARRRGHAVVRSG